MTDLLEKYTTISFLEKDSYIGIASVDTPISS